MSPLTVFIFRLDVDSIPVTNALRTRDVQADCVLGPFKRFEKYNTGKST